MTKGLTRLVVIFGAGFVLAAAVLLTSPGSVSANHGACPDGGRWGVHWSGATAPAGLVVTTQLASGTKLGGISFRLSTINNAAGYGYSIYHLASNYWPDAYYRAVNFTTGTGSGGGETTGKFWCTGYNGTSDNYTGRMILGFGAKFVSDGSYNSGNHFVLSCKDSTASGGLSSRNEEFRITNLATPAGRSGYWTGTAGWNTGFTVVNGATKWITLTWHDRNKVTVNSSGASSVGISGTQSSTGGTTNYSRTKTDVAVNTTLTAPSPVASNTKRFSSWSGCDSANNSNRTCYVYISGGRSQTVTANYVDNTGRIQGLKVRMPGNRNLDPPASETVRLDGGSPTTANPYSFQNVTAGNHTVSVTAPTGWRVGYTLCYNRTNCHGANNRVFRSSVRVNVPAGGYADLWWHYDPLDLLVEPLPVIDEVHVGDDISGVFFNVREIMGELGTPAFRVRFCLAGTASYTCPGGWTNTWNISLPRRGFRQINVPTFKIPDPGVYPTTLRLVAIADLPQPGDVREENEIINNRTLRSYVVIGPPPWFSTTTGGDVGSCGRIDPKIPPPAPHFSADYLVIQNDDKIIRNFTSRLDWLVKDYEPLNIGSRDCSVAGSMYDDLLEKYTVTGAVGNQLNGLSGGVVIRDGPGTLTIAGTTPRVYSGPPAVVFVPQNMNINTELHIGANTGIIFIVQGRMQIAHSDGDGDPIKRVDGFFIVDGGFRTLSVGNSSEEDLTVNGSALVGFNNGEFKLERDFRSARSWTDPTEVFDFEPKYLWLFRDIIGDTKSVWKEVAP